jgi:hypothetical protein
MLEAIFEWLLAFWQTRRNRLVENTERDNADAAFSGSGVEFKDDMEGAEVLIYSRKFIAFHVINR